MITQTARRNKSKRKVFGDLRREKIAKKKAADAAALASQKAASQIVLRGTSPGLASSTRVRKMGVRSDE